MSPNQTVGRGMPTVSVARGSPVISSVSGFTRSVLTRPPPVASPLAAASCAKRARKDRGPNWIPQEIFALIQAKRDMFLEELDTIDGRDLMTPETSKWMRVSQHVMRAGHSPCFRDGTSCKTKWNQLIPDYKRIADFLSRTGRNAPDYWDMSATERKSEGLPRLFGQDVFDVVHEWYGSRPQIQPPHVRDLLSPNDANYRPIHQSMPDDVDDAQSEPETEDPMEQQQPEAPETTKESSPPRTPRSRLSTPVRPNAQPESISSPVYRAFNGMLREFTRMLSVHQTHLKMQCIGGQATRLCEERMYQGIALLQRRPRQRGK